MPLVAKSGRKEMNPWVGTRFMIDDWWFSLGVKNEWADVGRGDRTCTRETLFSGTNGNNREISILNRIGNHIIPTGGWCPVCYYLWWSYNVLYYALYDSLYLQYRAINRDESVLNPLPLYSQFGLSIIRSFVRSFANSTMRAGVACKRKTLLQFCKENYFCDNNILYVDNAIKNIQSGKNIPLVHGIKVATTS